MSNGKEGDMSEPASKIKLMLDEINSINQHIDQLPQVNVNKIYLIIKIRIFSS